MLVTIVTVHVKVSRKKLCGFMKSSKVYHEILMMEYGIVNAKFSHK